MNLLGTGSALPELHVSNDDLATFLDTSDEWIRSRTGIGSRRIMTHETLRDLGVEAGRRALEESGVAAEEIDYLICSTVQGDTITPALASLLQVDLGLDCPAFDLNAACAGFIYALDIAQAFIASGRARHVLIVCAESMSRMSDWNDRATCVLFGDGAGAVVAGPGDALKAMCTTSAGALEILNAYPDMGNCPYTKNRTPASKLYMAGQEVFKFAVTHSLKDLRAVMATAGITPDEVSHFVLHQANKRIVDAVRTRLRQPEEKFPVNIQKTGNTSSASVPILLDELNRSGALKAGDRLAMSAFGAGLVTGALVIEWTKGA